MKTFARWLPVLSCVLFACGSSTSTGGDGTDPDTGAPTDDTGTGGGDGTSGDTAGGKDTGPATGDTKTGGDTKAGGDTGPVVDTGPVADTGSGGGDTSVVPDTTTAGGLKTVFIIMMENHSWSSIKGSSKAPYINGTLLPLGGYATNYFTPPGNHPSEPNYIWLEAGDNLGISNDALPSSNSKPTTDHLVTELEAAGVTWKSYQEDIDGTSCPLVDVGSYAPKHNPMVFFDDVTASGDPTAARCIAHVRPYTELASDLAAGTVPRYNFISPNLCHDMHDTCGLVSNPITQGDSWLAGAVPAILNSAAYRDGGVLFITWDEGGGDGPIGLLALSSRARGHGYRNTIPYTHSSLLATLQRIFDVGPPLGDAATATDLRDLFGAPIGTLPSTAIPSR
ncbi:MAG: hypothetical protein NVS3B10_09460 [Polyangiales bacterium]